MTYRYQVISRDRGTRKALSEQSRGWENAPQIEKLQVSYATRVTFKPSRLAQLIILLKKKYSKDNLIRAVKSLWRLQKRLQIFSSCLGLEADLLLRFRLSHHHHCQFLSRCSQYCQWYIFLKTKIEVEQGFGNSGEVEVKDVGYSIGQSLNTLIEYIVIRYVLSYYFLEFVVRVIRFEKVCCWDMLF